MIKITVNHAFGRTLLVLLSLLGLVACAPITLHQLPAQSPQVYPTQPLTSNGQFIPQAGALPTDAVARQTDSALSQAPALPVKAKQSPAVPIAIPPVLKPVQPSAANSARYGNNYRPTARVPVSPQRPAQRERVRNTTPVPSRKQTLIARRPVVASKPAMAASNSVQAAKPASTRSRQTPLQPTVSSSQPAQATVQTSGQQVVANTAQPQTKAEMVAAPASSLKPTPTEAKKTPAVTAKPRSYSGSPAVAVLTKQASQQLTTGKPGRAAATLERALRIEPENPLLWLRLAEVNARQGKKSQAASMARRAIGLAPGDSGLQARGQRLLN